MHANDDDLALQCMYRQFSTPHPCSTDHVQNNLQTAVGAANWNQTVFIVRDPGE